jgi:hypothetical protein
MEELENVAIKTIAVDGIDVVYRWDHIIHYMSEGIYNRCLALSEEDKNRYFRMATDYGDIIQKILDDPEHSISLMGAIKPLDDVTNELEIQYEEWKSKQ